MIAFRRIACTAALAALPAAQAPAGDAVALYTVIDLGDLPLESINDRGQVAAAATGSCAFVFDRDHAGSWIAAPLPDSCLDSPNDVPWDMPVITNSGIAVQNRYSSSGGAYYAKWWQNGVPGGNLPLGSLVRDANNAGRMVGQRNGDAFHWEKGTIQVIEAGADALGINRRGQVAGYRGAEDDPGAVRWERSGGGGAWVATDLGTLGGPMSWAAAISDRGEVVGTSLVDAGPSQPYRAFLWRDGEMIDLGVIPGFQNSRALDVNGCGDIVGDAVLDQEPYLRRAIIWVDQVAYDLNGLVLAGPAMELTSARAINGHGLIAATGRDATGQPRDVILVPNRPADLDDDGTVGIDDLLALLEAWGACPACDADLDSDGVVGWIDAGLLVSTWTGCR